MEDEILEKSMKLADQILLIIKSDFPENKYVITGVMNTLVFALCKYAIRNELSVFHLLYHISMTHSNFIQQGLKKEADTSVN